MKRRVVLSSILALPVSLFAGGTKAAKIKFGPWVPDTKITITATYRDEWFANRTLWWPSGRQVMPGEIEADSMVRFDHSPRIVRIPNEPAHWSDCAVYNDPAYPPGPCNCGRITNPIPKA